MNGNQTSTAILFIYQKLINCRFNTELARFKKIFNTRQDTLVLGVAGNHDIGFGETSTGI